MLHRFARSGLNWGIQKGSRPFSILENKLAFIDIWGDGDEFEEVDRDGMKLPPFGSIVSYTAQREYHVGVYEGTKMIDGIQKLQIRNEHDCIRDVSFRYRAEM